MAEDLSAQIANAARAFEAKNSGLSLTPSNKRGQGYGAGFLESTLSAVPELIGLPPTEGAEAFRTENPKMGFASELIGGIGPYGAYGKLATKVPAIMNLSEAAGNMAKTPILSGALKSATFWAPAELGRAAVSTAINPDEAGQNAANAGLNLGLEAALGGVGAVLGAGGKVLKAERAFKQPTADLGQEYVAKTLGSEFKETPVDKLPAQHQLRLLQTALNDGQFPDTSVAARAKNQLNDLVNKIRWEDVGLNHKAVGELENGKDVHDVNRLFKEEASPGGTIQRAKLVVSAGKGFADKSARDGIAKAAGLEGNWDAVSLPRYVAFSGKGAKGAASKVQGDLIDRAGFQSVDENTLMSKEKSGLYVMAKKVTGNIKEPAATDEWVVWKTDQPGRFVPQVKEFADKLEASQAFLREPKVSATGKPGLELFDKAVGLSTDIPMQNFIAADQKGLLSQGIKKATQALGLPDVEPGSSWLASRGRSMVEHYITPSINQFTKNPVAKWAWTNARAINDMYQKAADEMLFGEAVSSGAKTFAKVFKDPETSGIFKGGESISKISADLNREDIHQIIHASERLAEAADNFDVVPGLIDQMEAAGDVTSSVADWLRKSNKLDKHLTEAISALEHQTGTKPTHFLPGHSMVSRTWEGDYRAIIHDADGQTLYVTGAKDPGLADAKAMEIIKQAEAEGMSGLKLTSAEKFDALNDLELSRNLALRSQEYAKLSQIKRKLEVNIPKPQTFKERQGVKGYQVEYSQKEFLDKLRGHVNDRYKYMSKLTRDNILGDKIQSIMQSDPKTYETLMTRLNQLDGQQGWFSKAQNQVVDKILGPALGGKNSASKIVDVVNGAQYALNFCFFNLGFPAVNAMTFLQTVMPEVAFVANATDNAVKAAYYDSVLMLGKDLKPRGVMGALSPAKMTYRSMKEMMKPSASTSKMLDQAIADGVVDPKLTAEFVGDTASYRTKLKDVMNGKEPFVNFIKSVSTFLPEQSERFARGQAFVTGKLVAEDLLGITDADRVYRFAKQFTQRTMYGYNTYDRPLAFTGPMGRAFGLFKNWQAHYIGQMLEYAGEAGKGNWSPLLWQMGGTASLGGIAATPLAGVANAFSQMTTDKSLMQNFYSTFGASDPDSPYGNVQDAAFWGLPAFLGLSLSGNASAPGSNPARDAAALLSFAQWNRAKDIASFMGAAVDTWSATGDNPAKSPEVRDKLIQAFAPKTVQHYWAATDGEVRSLRTGNTVVKGLSDPELILYKLGLTPKRLGISYATQNELWEDQNKMKSALTNMGRLWMEAQDNGDTDTLVSLTQRAMAMGIPIESIAKSANTRREKHTTAITERQFDPVKVAPYKELGLAQ